MQDAMAKCDATVSAQATIRRVGRFNERMTAAAADVAIVMASKFDHARRHLFHLRRTTRLRQRLP